MPKKEFDRNWKTSTKLFTLARYIERNRATFNMSLPNFCVWGMAEKLSGAHYGPDLSQFLANIFPVTREEFWNIFFAKFNRIDVSFPNMAAAGLECGTKLPCEVLRFLAKEYRKKGE